MERRRNSSRAKALTEGLLWTMGCVLLGYAAFVYVAAQLAQNQGNRVLAEAWKEPGSENAALSANRPEGSLMGRMEIPRIHFSAIVFEGTSDSTLELGVGHMSGSGNPGERGNIVFAGHRDTFFRGLRSVKKGDEIDITGSQGYFRYRVDSLFIVDPDQVEVLRPSASEKLTLITCYPFSYFGSAPQRYIVRAERIRPAAPEGNL